MASHNDTYHREILNEHSNNWINIELDNKMNATLDEYLNSKTSGGRDNVNYHPNPILKKSIIMDKLSLDSSKPIITLFTNVLWDAQIFYESNAFSGLLEWIFVTIDEFMNLDNFQYW